MMTRRPRSPSTWKRAAPTSWSTTPWRRSCTENMKAVGTAGVHPGGVRLRQGDPGHHARAGSEAGGPAGEDPSARRAASSGRAEYDKYEHQPVYPALRAPRPSPSSGSSDVGDVSWVCPTSQIVAATCAGGTAEHTWQMVAQGKILHCPQGTPVRRQGAGRRGHRPAGRPGAGESGQAEEFREQNGGQSGYQPLLPKDAKP